MTLSPEELFPVESDRPEVATVRICKCWCHYGNLRKVDTHCVGSCDGNVEEIPEDEYERRLASAFRA